MGLIENVKDAALLVQKIGNIELYDKLVSLQTDLMSLIEENWHIKEENRALKEQLRDLKNTKDIHDSLVFENNAYYRDTGSQREGPFCSKCFDVDTKLVRILEGGYGPYCPSCMSQRKLKR